MKTYIQYLVFVIIVFPLPYSCDQFPEPGECPDTQYTVDDFDEMTQNGLSTVAGVSIAATDLTFEFLFEVTLDQTAVNATEYTQVGNGFFPSAKALSCLGPTGKETLRILRVTSDQDFNETLQAGDDLSASFRSIYAGSEDLEQLFIEVVGFSDEEEGEQGFTSIELQDFPTEAGTHVFTIDIQLSGGRTFTATSAPIRFY